MTMTIRMSKANVLAELKKMHKQAKRVDAERARAYKVELDKWEADTRKALRELASKQNTPNAKALEDALWPKDYYGRDNRALRRFSDVPACPRLLATIYEDTIALIEVDDRKANYQLTAASSDRLHMLLFNNPPVTPIKPQTVCELAD